MEPSHNNLGKDLHRVTKSIGPSRRSLIYSFLLVVLSLITFTMSYAEEQKWCPLCSMNLKMFWKTNHWLTFSDGKKIGYCSIHCASLVYKDKAADIDKWQVVDFDTKKLVDAKKAHFLIGSDLPGTMTAVSKLAFSSLDTAKQYQREHGGQIGTFDDALKKALADLGADKAMIGKKVATMVGIGKKLAGKHGCFTCHGPEKAGSKAIAWNSREFVEKMDSRVKIKKTILNGTHEMKGYEGKIPEKELHAIALFVWAQRMK